MIFLLRALVTAIIMSFAVPAVAVKIEFHTFENAQLERVYLDLIAELRCVKCQNQNLAESDAELARDMRNIAYKMIVEGKTRQDVINFMTARYGDFVLYNPPFKSKTLLLWIGPPLLLLLSIFLLLRLIRNQARQQPEKMSDSDLESIRSMLKSNSNKEK